MTEAKPMKKVTIRLYEDDLKILQMTYPGVGYNQILRALAAKHVRRLRERTVARLGDTLTVEELKAI